MLLKPLRHLCKLVYYNMYAGKKQAIFGLYVQIKRNFKKNFTNTYCGRRGYMI